MHKDRDGFYVNYIDPIGINTKAPPTNNVFFYPHIDDDCRSGIFDFHAFSCDSEFKTWDACLRYDVDTDPDNVQTLGDQCGNPVSETACTWNLPCNVQDTIYLDNLIDDWALHRDTCINPFECGSIDDNITITIN